eukprot:14973332-Heterocapsa_arctica.AAC.1
MVHPYICVLPMGFSWAFYLAQEGRCAVVSRALPNVRFLQDLMPAPDLLDKSPIAFTYADNANRFGLDRESVNEQRSIVDAELNRT